MTSSAPLFDQLAANYEEHFAASHRRAYDALAWEVVARHLPETAGLVVDVGCGIGRWVERFLALGHRVIGIENSPAMAAAARRRIRNPRFRLIEDSMESVELPERAMADLVVAKADFPQNPHRIAAGQACRHARLGVRAGHPRHGTDGID